MEIIYGDGSELAFAHDMEQTLLSMNDFNSGAFKGSHEEGKIDLADRTLWITTEKSRRAGTRPSDGTPPGSSTPTGTGA